MTLTLHNPRLQTLTHSRLIRLTAVLLVAVIAGEVINLIEARHAMSKTVEIIVGAFLDKLLDE